MAKTILCRLTVAQREKLVEHAAGPIPFVTGRPRGDNTNATILALVRYGLLNTLPQNARWTQTELSLTGREIAVKILAGYADALVAAGALEASAIAERPLAILRRLRRDGKTLGESPESPGIDPGTPPGEALFTLE